MDEKILINEIKANLDEGYYNIALNLTNSLCAMKQKSKKTDKIPELYGCAFKVLYATKKYGCSGIKGDAECLECKYRR